MRGEIKNISPIFLKRWHDRRCSPLWPRVIKMLVHFATAIIIWEVLRRTVF